MTKEMLTTLHANCRCEDEYDPAVIAQSSPSTFLVHSKWPFMSPAERTVRRLYVGVLQRHPSEKERGILVPQLQSGQLDRETVFLKLCHSREAMEQLAELLVRSVLALIFVSIV